MFGEVGSIGVPDATKIDLFALAFENVDDFGMVGEAFDERVFHGCAETRGEFQIDRWIEFLVAKKYHLMVKERLSNDCCCRGGQR